MFSRRFRRSSQHRLLRLAGLILSVLFVLDILSLLKAHRQFSQNLLSHAYTEVSSLPSPVKDQKIFICAQFWTNAEVIEKRWAQALLTLIETLGAENVYVSIYESGSLDWTKDVLQHLDRLLIANNVRRTVTLDPTTHQDEIDAGPVDESGNPRPGWVLPPNAKDGKEVRRIPYLARLRNLSLKPLHEERAQGRIYDKILFLNDVVFRPSDVLSLLATNQGSFSAACALDFQFPGFTAAYYDTFALRDVNGDSTLQLQFPYFRHPESRDSILRGSATKVSSCWNGMVAMEALPFYQDHETGFNGLQFRGISDSLASKHLEGSECCLIHVDLALMGAASKGIYVNPAVRVGYIERAYEQTHFGSEETFISASQYVRGVWLDRINRIILPSAESQMKVVDKRLEQWAKGSESTQQMRVENERTCLVPETHVLIWNGWRHA